ncbi:MAG: hypothetical protein RI841_12510, partial [Halomonas sp.]|uniref:hypothetical protein n=1 Tax=Halomonas sp. TaxID=1486246 RepID=UPI002870A6C8
MTALSSLIRRIASEWSIMSVLRSGPYRWLMRLALPLLLATLLTPAAEAAGNDRGGILTQQEMTAVGHQYGKVQAEWQAELDRHDARVREIESSSRSRSQKDALLQREVRLHRAESQRVAKLRHQVQDVLISEANARAAHGSSATRRRIEASLGTSIDDPAHRGMRGDLDAAGGVRSVDALKQVLLDMGLDHVPVRELPGTLEIGTEDIGGKFEMTVHKGGLGAPPGSQFAEIRDAVDARNHEVYLSERMRNRAAGTKQVGTDFVEVQDHFKKAAEGLRATGRQLVDKEKLSLMQSLAKGTAKTLQIGDIPDAELGDILRQHGIDQAPAEFRERLQALKEQRIFIDDPAEAARLRDVGNEVFTRAEQRAYQRSQVEIETRRAEIDRIREKIRKVDAMSDRPETRARRDALKKSLQAREKSLRSEVIDSQSKMRAAAEANADIRQQSGGERPRVTTDADGQPRAPGDAADTAAGSRAPQEGNTGKGAPAEANAQRSPPEAQGNWQKAKSGAARAYQVYGVVTDIADIGKRYGVRFQLEPIAWSPIHSLKQSLQLI